MQADRLSGDLINHLQHHALPDNLENSQHDFALFLLSKSLQTFYHTLTDFGLPPPVVQWERQLHPNRLIAAEMNCNRDDLAAQAADMTERLNDDQRTARQAIQAALEEDAPRPLSFFLTGSGGTGKTSFFETLYKELRSQKKIVFTVASTGVAARLLPGSRTCHSRFGIPVPAEEDSVCSISKNSAAAQLI